MVAILEDFRSFHQSVLLFCLFAMTFLLLVVIFLPFSSFVSLDNQIFGCYGDFACFVAMVIPNVNQYMSVRIVFMYPSYLLTLGLRTYVL